ncbi:MAG: ABC-F family ATP-binding cassette domain-containing protein [Acidobacteria bacterium]|nr:ABC-F family ATP-binding cassette domain-containing protein [Acidobacteriota bacterium]
MLFRLSNVEKGYGGTEILRGVSFQVNPGEKVGLVGRNGAGKTTVFRLLTGSENPDVGEVVKANGLKLGLLDQHVNFEKGQTVHQAALSAFQAILKIESEMRELELRMADDHSPEILERYADLQTAFEQADGFTYSARAESILLGLGFSPEYWGHDTATLSGGQKNRLGMARLLLSGADVLLLDEPTNHLDVNAVEWLEEFLREYQTAYVVISHDRYFLDRTTDRIIEIDNGKAAIYKGNYSQFLVERELRRDQQRREYENQQSHIAKTQEFIRRNLEGQKTKQAKSRRTMLERMEKIDRVIEDRSGGHFGLKSVERAGNNVLTVEDLAIGYGSAKLAEGIGLSLHRSEVLGIIGANGTGKTTFLKTILGNLSPLEGEVRWGTKTNIGYYSQNLDDLHEANEIIQELRRVDPLADNGTLRSFLARFLFVGEDVFKKVSDLSGGEKGRLALAKLIYSRKNVLVLDEPTNHLDIPSREALEDALTEYDGTVVTVSHDRFFLDKIATQILAFELGGVVNIFNGNYTEYHDFKVRVSGDKNKEATAADPVKTPSQSEETSASNVPVLSKNQRDRIARSIEEIESKIQRLEAERDGLTVEMNLPENASDVERFTELTERFQTTEESILSLYAEWETFEAQLSER